MVIIKIINKQLFEPIESFIVEKYAFTTICTLFQFRENGGVGPLVTLLGSGNDDVRRSASWAITVLAADEYTAGEICKYR